MDRWDETTFGAPLANVLRMVLTAPEAAVPTLPRVFVIWGGDSILGSPLIGHLNTR